MRKIMLVEDDVNFRTVLAMTLELQGYAICQVDCVQSALELLSSERPDMIISDLQMRGIDGRALCKRIRGDASLPRIPFIILSAFVDPDVPKTLADLPADRCLSKQIPIKQLIQIIAQLLDSSTAKELNFDLERARHENNERPSRPPQVGTDHEPGS